jgi:hypothetical protein
MSIAEMGRIALVGIGATAVLDTWLFLLKRCGVQAQSFALIGRWVAYCLRGNFMLPSIAKAPPIRGELALGWVTHYAIGILFAALLFAVEGASWWRSPTLLPAAIVGVCTVIAPLAVMQPAMGAGFAASKTATPWRNRARSVINHAVFGAGLYLTAVLINWLEVRS